MTERKKNIKVLTREVDGFTATIQHRPGQETICRVCGEPKTAHEPTCHMRPFNFAHDPLLRAEVATLGRPTNHCLNCPTEIDPEENFCAHCYSLIPDDLTGAWFNCRTENGRLLSLQGMVDHLARLKEGPVPVRGLVDPELLADLITFLDQVRSDCLSAGPDAAPHTVKHINKLLIRIEEATQ